MTNWDERYARQEAILRPPSPTLVRALEICSDCAGEALDLACGSGRNAIFLAGRGWRVTAVDKSPVALSRLAELAAATPPGAIQTVHADLETGEFAIAPESYDLVCDVYFLHRPLFAKVRDGVRAGGLFVAEFPMVDNRPGVPPMNPAYLLETGELLHFFNDWEILAYTEQVPPRDAAHGRLVASLIARKPGESWQNRDT